MTFSQTTPTALFHSIKLPSKNLSRSINGRSANETRRRYRDSLRDSLDVPYCIYYPTISFVETRFLGKRFDRPRDRPPASLQRINRTNRRICLPSRRSHPLASSFPFFFPEIVQRRKEIRAPRCRCSGSELETFLTTWRLAELVRADHNE